MPICPYCKKVSFTRRMHVSHLQQSHSTAHAHNIATARGCTISVIPPCPRVDHSVTFGPAVHDVDTPPQANVHAFPLTLHCTVCFEYESRWVRAASDMVVVSACRRCTWSTYYDYRTRCEHADQAVRLHCRGGVCQHPHSAPGYDDRIRDWGSRGRVGNVYCQGHLPVLCPVGADWLRSHFVQRPHPPPSPTRSPTPSVPTVVPVEIADVSCSGSPFEVISGSEIRDFLKSLT